MTSTHCNVICYGLYLRTSVTSSHLWAYIAHQQLIGYILELKYTGIMLGFSPSIDYEEINYHNLPFIIKHNANGSYDTMARQEILLKLYQDIFGNEEVTIHVLCVSPKDVQTHIE